MPLRLHLPWILKLVIDSIKNYPQSSRQLIIYAGLIVGLAAIEGIFRFYMRRLLIGVSRKMEYSIRADFFVHLQRLDSSFFENNRTGSIMALISNDLDAVRNFLGPGLLNLFSTVFAFASTSDRNVFYKCQAHLIFPYSDPIAASYCKQAKRNALQQV